jgi:hypothetical protein
MLQLVLHGQPQQRNVAPLLDLPVRLLICLMLELLLVTLV